MHSISTLWLLVSANTISVFGQVTDILHPFGNVNTTCDPNASNCMIYCDSPLQCGAESSGGPTLDCPSGSNCNYCYIYCNGTKACAHSTINSHSCSNVDILLDEGDDTANGIIINAPFNNGNLSVKLGSSSTNRTFYDSLINSYAGTNLINITCPSMSGKNSTDNCYAIAIHGESAKHVQLNCMKGSSCDDVYLWCPTNSTLNSMDINNNFYTWPKPCEIQCINSQCSTLRVYIESYRWEDDISFICRGTCGATVSCSDKDYGMDGAQCILEGTDYCRPLVGSGDYYGCQPTQAPIMAPSWQPTKPPTAATKSPSKAPTDRPSNLPTDTPSNMPTVPPTNQTEPPSNHPSDIPSNMPTVIPTMMPTEIPSSEPTIIPTVIPTALPTALPSDDPTMIPTILPSGSPTSNPTHTPSRPPSLAPVVSSNNDNNSNSIFDNSDDFKSIIVLICVTIVVLLIIMLVTVYKYRKVNSQLIDKKMKKTGDVDDKKQRDLEMVTTTETSLRSEPKMKHKKSGDNIGLYQSVGL